MELVWIPVVCMLSICLSVLLLLNRKLVARNKVLEKEVEKALALNVQAEDLLGQVGPKFEEYEAKVERLQKMYDLHREQNEEFERQKNKIWDMYQLQALQAGNAQSKLLTELERAVKVINGYREKEGKDPIQVNPMLAASVDQFKREHVHDG